MFSNLAANLATNAINSAINGTIHHHHSDPTVVVQTDDEADDEGLVWRKQSLPIPRGRVTVMEAAADPAWNRTNITMGARGSINVSKQFVPNNVPAYYRLVSQVQVPDREWLVGTLMSGSAETFSLTIPPSKSAGCIMGCFTIFWSIAVVGMMAAFIAGGVALFAVFLVPFLGAGGFLGLQAVRSWNNSTIVTADESAIRVVIEPVKLFLKDTRVDWEDVCDLRVKRGVHHGDKGTSISYSVLAIGNCLNEETIMSGLPFADALFVLQELQRVKQSLKTSGREGQTMA